MTVIRVNGMIVIFDMIKGYLVTHRYLGYTITEAKRLFVREYLKS